MNGLQYTIKKAIGLDILTDKLRQDFEVWYNPSPLWLDLQDILTNSTLEGLGTLTFHVDYQTDLMRPGDGINENLPPWGRCCIFVMGVPLGVDVIGLVRAEYDAMKLEQGYGDMDYWARGYAVMEQDQFYPPVNGGSDAL